MQIPATTPPPLSLSGASGVSGSPSKNVGRTPLGVDGSGEGPFRLSRTSEWLRS